MTGLVNPFGFDAVQWKIRVVTGWKMSRVISVGVRVGFTPVQFGFGQPGDRPGDRWCGGQGGWIGSERQVPVLDRVCRNGGVGLAGPASTLF